MLTINLIRENKEFVIERLKVKNFNAEAIIDKILELDSKRRSNLSKTDALQAEMNKKAKQIGLLMKEGKKDEAEEAKKQTYTIKEEIKSLSEEIGPIDAELKSQLVLLPNLPHASVPRGFGAADNEVVRQCGVIPNLDENALPHWELIKKYDIIDFELGTKLTGAGFPVYKGKGDSGYGWQKDE